MTQAGGTYRVRGLATSKYSKTFAIIGTYLMPSIRVDVANYNALVAATPDPITQGNANYDENLYINALAPLLATNNFPGK